MAPLIVPRVALQMLFIGLLWWSGVRSGGVIIGGEARAGSKGGEEDAGW